MFDILLGFVLYAKQRDSNCILSQNQKNINIKVHFFIISDDPVVMSPTDKHQGLHSS